MALSEITPLLRDYLAEIYQAAQIELNGKNGFVSTSELAERMAASQPTVNRTVERLFDFQLIQYERYVGVKLTAQGQQEAADVLRKQAVLESFLVNVLKFQWHQVYVEARQMRHHISDAVINRMWEAAGRSLRSPFGEWIDPPQIEPPQVLLANAEDQQDYQIARILTRQPDRLEYLAALGLTPDVRVHIHHKAPFHGPIQLHLDTEYRIVGHELAKVITLISDEIKNLHKYHKFLEVFADSLI